MRGDYHGPQKSEVHPMNDEDRVLINEIVSEIIILISSKTDKREHTIVVLHQLVKGFQDLTGIDVMACEVVKE